MEKMRDLITRLNTASRAYYQENREVMSDYEYDALYDQLVKLEAQTGIQLAQSPTRKVGYEIISALEKAPHNIPMLSLDKTKDVPALAGFLGDKEGLLIWKLDGLSIALRYNGGQLAQALTRGNGQIGEDVTHNAKVFANIPLTVPYQGSFTVRGEAVITFEDFEAINEDIARENAAASSITLYKNPRNLCSGTVRQLNSEVASKRRVFFYAFGAVTHDEALHTMKSGQLEWLEAQGFEVAASKHVNAETVAQAVEDFKAQIPTQAVATDGLVLTFDDMAYSESLGATSKFPRDSIAFKWADDLAETNLVSIEWNPSRTGLINPVAIFEPVEIEGSVVGRASLHNVSILRNLELGVGDRITVYKANMIIPQVAENMTRSNTIEVPAHCPVCDGKTEITTQRHSTSNESETESADSDSEVLICINPSCGAKLMQSLVHFVSRDGLNIEGLSEQTLEKLLVRGIVSSFPDLFVLSAHKETITTMEGFGRRSYEKLIAATEKAKDIALPNFIYALGIRHVGLSNAKLLCAHFNHDFEQIVKACQSSDYQEILAEVKGFGDAIAHSLHMYFSQESNVEIAGKTLSYLRIKVPTPAAEGTHTLTGLIFVVTGDVQKYENRKALQNHIESLGGKVTSSVTAKTSYLINNNPTSSSSKNKKAAELGVPVITEDGFLELI
ncbi:MAG: NAD-dependent DNA ligase LigA [Defluviitaleaceae bacterium]|nr:NAD-dependent DNA ligase LigA [Defluviitaleaceae bacterium]